MSSREHPLTPLPKQGSGSADEGAPGAAFSAAAAEVPAPPRGGGGGGGAGGGGGGGGGRLPLVMQSSVPVAAAANLNVHVAEVVNLISDSDSSGREVLDLIPVVGG